MAVRLKEALPHTLMVSINRADHEGDWDRLMQPLDRGSFNVTGFLDELRNLGYQGPIGLQCYSVKGDREENLKRSMAAWQSFRRSAANCSTTNRHRVIPRGDGRSSRA
jgi:sugar phosphate isomerase/epimerase